ncbi:MAG: LytTR family DNA-binding domain-containing protein [Lachnospiraceae bacterium]|nr:LytTR family DNA-binding domain-containing protein [Lachnospiraceae bacterium]
MKIGICDGNKEYLDILCEALSSKTIALPNAAAIELFYSGNDLVNYYEKNGNYLDLLISDIEMPGLSGIKAAHIIRKKDKQVIIIFLANHCQYISQALKVEIFDYLVKPLDITELNSVIKRAVEKYQEQQHLIEIKSNGNLILLEANTIIKIESEKNYINFYTSEKKYRYKGSLKEYEVKLAPNGFLKCHNSVLVNAEHIHKIETDRIVTTTGLIADISIRRRGAFLRELEEYNTRLKI